MNTESGTFARLVLEKLLQKAERAWARQRETRTDITLLFSDSSLPEYFRLPLRADKDAAHADLRAAERKGAIALEWERRAGIDGQIQRARLLDPEIVASCLARSPVWSLFNHAEEHLQPWSTTQAVRDVLARWRQGKQVRGLGPQRVSDFIDACKVIDTCRQQAVLEDVPVRRLSAALFADSKRIENITLALDILTNESVEALARDPEDVRQSLGLVRFHQPVLLAGTASIEVVDGQILPIPSPYIGVAPQSIRDIHLLSDEGYLLSVENLTTFHELALGRGGPLKGLILYTAGMPSPALTRVYRLCAKANESSTAPRLHWGDIDLGGFRIASRLASLTGNPLQLWAMDPTRYPEAPSRKNLSKEECDEIEAIGKRWGWEATTAHVRQTARAIEQEAIQIELP